MNRYVIQQMKEKWKDLGIKTNEEAIVAYLVLNGADFNVNFKGDILLPHMVLLAADPLAVAIIAIRKQRRYGALVAIILFEHYAN